MDLANILQDAGTVTAIATGIVFVIQFLKNMFYKLPWGWVKKTPGEVWFALSIVASVGVVFALNFDIFSSGMSVDTVGQIVSGLTVGAGSKLIHAVATPAGAKFKQIKKDIETKTETPLGAAPCPTPEELTTPVTCNEPIQAPEVVTPEVVLYKRVGVDSEQFFVEVEGKLYPVQRNVFYEKEGE